LRIQQDPGYGAPGSCVYGLQDTKFPVPEPSCGFPSSWKTRVCATV
jgi:hypothetical protein